MKGKLNFSRGGFSILAVLAVTMGLLASGPAPTARASADFGSNPNPGVLPPNAKPFGKTYGEWNDAWVQWVMGISADRNPLLDDTGANCAEGQTGQVWFLAGALGGQFTRSCNIPAGKPLFFPILNVWCDSSPAPHASYQELQACAGPQNDATHVMSVEVDGRSITNLHDYWSFTPPPNPFVETLPENNLYQYLGFPIPAGDYDAYAEGYYLMLAPLSRGVHVIHFHGEATDSGFVLDITYNLNIR